MTLKLLNMFYRDRSEERRVESTVRALEKLSPEEVARYIVTLEMRLEALGHQEHFTDEHEPQP